MDSDKAWTGVSETDPTYRLLVDVDNEISIVHSFMKDKYRMKFPELESLVHHPVDYARVIKAIGNEMDITLVNLEDVLPQVLALALLHCYSCCLQSGSKLVGVQLLSL